MNVVMAISRLGLCMARDMKHWAEIFRNNTKHEKENKATENKQGTHPHNIHDISWYISWNCYRLSKKVRKKKEIPIRQ